MQLRFVTFLVLKGSLFHVSQNDLYYLCVFVNFHAKKGSELTQTEVKKMFFNFFVWTSWTLNEGSFFCIFNILDDDITAFLTMS